MCFVPAIAKNSDFYFGYGYEVATRIFFTTKLFFLQQIKQRNEFFFLEIQRTPAFNECTNLAGYFFTTNFLNNE